MGVNKKPNDDDRGWYESWLDGIAGQQVQTGRITLVWLLLTAAIGGATWLTFGRNENAFFYPVAAGSFAYWFFLVPQWIRHKHPDGGDRSREADGPD